MGMKLNKSYLDIFITILSLILTIKRIVCIDKDKALYEKYTNLAICNEHITENLKSSININAEAPLKDKNAFIWENQWKYIKRKSEEQYNEIKEHYTTDNTICICLDCNNILTTKLAPAIYNTLIIVGKYENMPFESFKEIKIFLLLNHLANCNIEIDRFVFYNVEEHNLSAFGLYIERKGKVVEPKSVEIIFHDSNVNIFDKIEQNMLSRFLITKIKIVYIKKTITEIDQFKDIFLSSKVELRMKGFPTAEQYKTLSKIPNLDVLWITGTTPYDLLQKSNRFPEHKDTIYPRKIYMRLEAFQYYITRMCLFSSIIRPKERIVVFIKESAYISSSDINQTIPKDTVYDLSALPNTIGIEFQVFCNKHRMPAALNYIFALICRSEVSTHTIYIKNIQTISKQEQSMQNIPLYYAAKNIDNYRKLNCHTIIILSGNNRESLHLKPETWINQLKQNDNNMILKNCFIIMEKKKFIKEQNNLFNLVYSSKVKPGCLIKLHGRNINNEIKCINCKKKVLNIKNTSDRNHEYIMVYTCGHISCEACGYEHITQEEFMHDANCKLCRILVTKTMIWINNIGKNKEIYSVVFLGPNLFLNDISNCFRDEFIFLYGSGTSQLYYTS